jgi:hypothetical protein
MRACRHPLVARVRRRHHVSEIQQRHLTASDDANENETHSQKRSTMRQQDPAKSASESLFDRVEDLLGGPSALTRGRRVTAKKKSNHLRFPQSHLNKLREPPPGATSFAKDQSSSVTTKSLFETFNIPKPSTDPLGPNAYDSVAYQEYMDVLQSLMRDDPKFMRFDPSSPAQKETAEAIQAWLMSRQPSVVPQFTSLTSALRSGATRSSHPDEAVSFVHELHNQRERYMQYHQFNQKQYKMASGTLFYFANICARQAKGEPVEIIWHKMKEAGMVDQKLLHTLLYLSTSFSSHYRTLSHSGLSLLDALEPHRPQTSGKPSDISFELLDEVAACHDLLYTPTEQTVNVKVRLLVAQEKPQEAEALLNTHVEGLDLRLRSFSPVLKFYLEQKDVSSALRTYKRMVSLSPVHLDVDTHIALLVGLAERGCFQISAPAIDGAEALGFASSSGPGLFDELVLEMANDVTEIPLASTKRLYNAFAAGFVDCDMEASASFAQLSLVSDPASATELIIDRVSIDPLTGECPRSGVKLRLIHLEEHQADKLRRGIVALAREMQVKFQENMKSSDRLKLDKARADDDLLDFYEWLDNREGTPFTAIVDGANVGYHMQNYGQGRFSYHQIQFVVDRLAKLGENPLVVLPSKYSRPHFYVTIGAGGSVGSRKQHLTPDEVSILDSLRRSGKLFIVPRGFLDDFYWILASLSVQTTSRNGRDLFVQPDNPDGRWPGGRPVLISNDQMRDHKVGLLEPRLFRRWFSNFIVNYAFDGYVDGKCSDVEIEFTPADFYSREIQSNDSCGSTVWHFPIAETEDEWLCIRIPSGKE